MYSRARTSVRAPVFDSADQRFASQRQAAYNRRQASYSRMRSAIPAPPMLLPSRTQEIKFFDCTTASANMVAVASVAGAEPAAAFTGLTELNAVSQGAGAYQRIGQKIVVKSIAFKCKLALQAVPGSTVTRIMLIYDKQPNGAFPAITDILSVNVSTAPGLMAGINMSKKSRFSILADRFFNTDSASNTLEPISIYRNNVNLETEFGATNGLISDITTGAIYLLCFDSGSTCAIQDVNTRIRFYDN